MPLISPATPSFLRSAAYGFCLALVSASGASANPGVAGEIYEVQASNTVNSVAIGGTVVPYQEVKLAAQLPGRIAALAGKEGDRFNKGDVLVALDETELLAQKAAAEAAIASADAAARNAHVQYQQELVNPRSERASQMPGMAMPGMFDQMFSRPMASVMGMESPAMQRHTDLHSQGTQVRQAQTGVTQAQAKLKQIEAKLRDAKSLAPFNGVIIAKSIEVGDTVQPGMPLLSFADLSSLQIETDIPSRLMRSLRVGMELMSRLDSGEVVPVRVAQIFPVADATRHTVKVKLDVPVSTRAAPGMYADVMVPDPDSNTASRPVVPRSALIWRGSVPGVMRVDASGTAKLRLVRVRDVGDPHTVQVFAGLKVGDRILLEP